MEFYGKTPDRITESELEAYFLRRRNVDKGSSATLRIAVSGVKFFFERVLQREWHIFTYLRSKKEHWLPSTLSREEVFRVLKRFKTFQNFACLSRIYACGLRMSEVLVLQVSDIDGNRMTVHVRRGKGANLMH